MGIPIRVLVVEDTEDDAELALRMLRKGGYEPVSIRVDTATKLRAAIGDDRWDAILCDHSMRGFSSAEALRIVQGAGLDLPFLIVSGTIGEEVAVSMMRSGAHDYILKQNLARLPAALERELGHAAARRARRESEEIIHRLAFYDTVTGIRNRASLTVALVDAIDVARASNQPLALVCIGLHRFREINSTVGNLNGDLILQCAAERLGWIGGGAEVFRIDPSKFALVCPGVDAEEAFRLSARAVVAFQAPIDVDGLAIEIGTSAGIVVYPVDGAEPELLLRRAEVALHSALQRLEPSVLYRKELEIFEPRRLELLSALRAAIESDQLRLEYQPKIDMRTGRVVGAEALLRWHHPELGSIRPDEFIPLAEESALIRPLTRWVLNEALRQCGAWRRKGMEINVAVNLSVRNLEDPDLASRIASLLRIYEVSPDWLTFEITESTIMAQARQSANTLIDLRNQGLALSIDDFGTGYSSLAYLRRLPVSELKIDRSFVFGLSGEQGDLAVVRTIIDLGHHLALKVVAEGVEDARTWNLLAEAGCDLAQGYYMARPMPPADFERWAGSDDFGLGVLPKDPKPDDDD